MSSLWMRVDQQNSQAGKVALGCKSVVKAFGETSNDTWIIELDAVLQILFDLINDRTQYGMWPVVFDDSRNQVIFAMKVPAEGSACHACFGANIFQGCRGDAGTCKNTHSGFENS